MPKGWRSGYLHFLVTEGGVDKGGTIRLDFRRDDRDVAADLATAIDELLEQGRR